MAERTSFLGTGWGFPPTFDRGRGGVVMVSDEQDIRESLIILLHTSLGERVMQPRYGANLRDQVFEPMDATAVTLVEDVIRTAFIYNEPRILVENVSVTPQQEVGMLNIQVAYLIRSTNTRFNLVLPYYIPEGSSII